MFDDCAVDSFPVHPEGHASLHVDPGEGPLTVMLSVWSGAYQQSQAGVSWRHEMNHFT